MRTGSLRHKLSSIKPQESIIIPCDDVKSLMRQIESIESRYSMNLGTKKAQIIVADTLRVAVEVTNTTEVEHKLCGLAYGRTGK